MSDIKQVIVMRKDLGMRKGKMIAQGAHASIAFMTNRMRLIGDAFTGIEGKVDLREEESDWIKGAFKKVCVYVESEAELYQIYHAANFDGLETHLITDSGLTEFNGVPTPTCLAIGPDRAEKIDVHTGHLPLL